MSAVPWLDADTIVKSLSFGGAMAALAGALAAGHDPEADPDRATIQVPRGYLYLMPAATLRATGVKVVSVAPHNPALGLPRVQGVYVLLDATTLAPMALLDGGALTSLRTPALSGVALNALAPRDARRLLVYGTGPQAWGHVQVARLVRPITEVLVRGRDAARTAAFVARCVAEGIDARPAGDGAIRSADVICCCTTARQPLFDGADVSPDATVLAIGSHEPHAREVDAALVRRATVVVESRRVALREAGDIIMAVRSGHIDPDALLTLAELVRDAERVSSPRPRLWKSVGMAWEDAVVAGAVHDAWRSALTR